MNEAAPAPRTGIGAALVLAALSAGAGVLHLVMAPIHADGSAVEAAGFALAGWLQLTIAALVLVRAVGARSTGDRPALLVASMSATLGFIAVWVLSRTVGLPLGAHPGTAEHVGAADLVTVGLEIVFVALAAVVLARPGLLARGGTETAAGAAVLAGAAVFVATLVVVSPSTANHSHGDRAAPVADAASRCDRALNPAAYWTEAAKAGVDTGDAPQSPSAPAADHHGHGAAAASNTTTTVTDPLGGRGSKALDSIIAKLGSDSEADAAQVVAALADLDDRDYEGFLYQLRKHAGGGHSAAHSTAGDDTGGHGGHMGPAGWVPMTDPAQCDALVRELDAARATALGHPTAADAERDGWRKVTPYVPGIGAHYINLRLVDGTFEVDKPEMLLYDGDGPGAHIVGVSYYIRQPGDAEPTQGFSGDNDHAHRHIGLCARDGLIVGASTTSEEECAAAGGRKTGGSDGWMSHAWVVPGCESPWGLFSGATPVLDAELPKHSGTSAGGCEGSKAKRRYDLSPGGPAGQSGSAGSAGGSETAAGR